MPLVEVLTPTGTLDEDLCERLLAEVRAVEGAPDTEHGRAISWLIVHPAGQWYVSSGETGAASAPRYLVRVSVPEGALDDGKRADLVRRVTRLLAEIEPDPDRLYREPAAWVHVLEIPDGSWGALGQVVRLPDILSYITTGAVRTP